MKIKIWELLNLNNLSYKKAVNDIKFVYSENNTLSIIFKNNDILMGVVGEFNNNLKELEKITDTSIYSRGNSILVKSTSKKNEMVKNAIVFLVDQFINNETIENKDPIKSPTARPIHELKLSI